MFPYIDRREALSRLARGAAAVHLLPLWGVACGSDTSKTSSSSTGGSSATTGNNATTTGTSGTVDHSKWATGGTQAMTAKSSYPNPFTATTATSCTLTCAATAGPCYLASGAPPTRADVSEGQSGLPMRMQLRVLDESCKPIANASIEIWHTSAVGLYSGKTPNTGFCSNGNAAAIAAQYFRGVATTDASGIATFDSCFPGWYTSRTVHVHARISVSATEVLTTQFVFADAVVDAIVAEQPLYKDRGSRDTTNQNDTVVSASAAADYQFDVQQMTDGAMLASKTVIVRTSDTGTVCTIPGGSGGPTGKSKWAPEGPPPGAALLGR